MKYRVICWVLLISLLAGCSSKGSRPPVAASAWPAAPFSGFYTQWRGTPYLLGGSSKQGVDCSAFVQHAYRDVLSRSIPRTTLMQSQTGESVAFGAWQVGDLIFFKTGRKQRHVGVYVGDGNFMHASTSVGVTVTPLTNPYWKTRYWMAKRY